MNKGLIVVSIVFIVFMLCGAVSAAGTDTKVTKTVKKNSQPSQVISEGAYVKFDSGSKVYYSKNFGKVKFRYDSYRTNLNNVKMLGKYYFYKQKKSVSGQLSYCLVKPNSNTLKMYLKTFSNKKTQYFPSTTTSASYNYWKTKSTVIGLWTSV